MTVAAQATVARALDLGPAGGHGGTAQSSECNISAARGGDRGVVVGINMRKADLVDRIEAVCAIFTNGVRGELFGALSKTADGAIGGTGGQPVQLICGPNKAVVGMRGRSGTYLDAVAIACASVNADGTIKSGTISWTNTMGGRGGTAFGPLLCGTRPVNALFGRGGFWVDSLTMHCQ
jgi:hypothetical protein